MKRVGLIISGCARVLTQLSGRLVALASRGALVSITLISVLCPAPVAAQPRPVSPWDKLVTPYFRHLTIPNDLPNVATVIAQDPAGFIWIATQDGLVRWDGYRSKLFQYSPQDPTSLPGNVITGLVIDKSGTLFVAMEDGSVARYDSKTEHFASLPKPSLGIGLYPAFISDGQGGLWLGNSNGLSHWKAGGSSWEAIDLQDHRQISSLLLAQDGALWAGTDQGLLIRRAGSPDFAPVAANSKTPLARSNVRSLLQSSDGDIWFGTNDGKIGSLSTTGIMRDVEIEHPLSAVLSLADLSTGVICASTAGSGVVFIDKTTAKVVQAVRFDPLRPTGLADDFVYNLHVDRSGGLWIGHVRGVDYMPAGNGALQTLLPSERNASSISGSYIAAFLPRPDGEVWLGGDKGVDLLTSTTQDLKITHQKSLVGDPLPAALLYSMAISSNDHSWMGTGQGLFENDRGHISKYRPLADTVIRSLVADKDTLWVAAEKKGLMKLDLASHTSKLYQRTPGDANSLTDNIIIGLLNDPRRGLWIGTPHGLGLFQDDKFRTFMHDPADAGSLPADIVVGLLIDHRERAWFGTLGGGVALLEGDPTGQHRFRRIGRQEGLPSENVSSLVEDRQGRIWVGTDAGIAVIDPDSLSAHGFSLADGVVIIGYFPNAATRLIDGTLLLGGVGGVTVVHPEMLRDWTYKPEIAVTSVRVGQAFIPSSARISVPSDDHSLQVEFTALDYSSPERNQYAYKLEGVDKDWIPTDANHRLAAYTNLSPGTYTLLLRGSNSAGVWTDSPTRLSVEVLPAWYQTLWFKFVVLLLGVSAIAALIRSRTAYLRRRQKELEGQVAERTSEIASLLHNSGEGFLSFGADLIIDRQYSLACETFLGEAPSGKNAVALLFTENPKHAAFVQESVPTALTSADLGKRDLIVSLLPKEIDRRGRRLKTHYAVLENGHLMMVLRDITTERRLAERVASEHRRLGMIVAAISDSRDFFVTIENFRGFIKTHLTGFLASFEDAGGALQDTYRLIHTFKGEFNQLSFEKLPAALHMAEERLDDLRLSPEKLRSTDVEDVLSSANLIDVLHQDLAIIRKALGDDFLDKGGHITMTQYQARELKKLINHWRAGADIDLRQPEVSHLLEDIDRMGMVLLKDELLRHDLTIAQVALRLEKEVHPLIIKGQETVWLDPDVHGPFLASLIHIFRNCVTHGIESPDVRLEKGKNEAGRVSCQIDILGSMLELTISDDGAGVNIDSLRQQIVRAGYCTAEYASGAPEDEMIGYIFQDRITTATEADHWAGRGVGLAAVRREVEALGGRISVDSHPHQGTRFLIRLQLPATSYRAA